MTEFKPVQIRITSLSLQQNLHKNKLQLIVSLLGTKANHCPSTGLCRAADLHHYDWAKSSHIHP